MVTSAVFIGLFLLTVCALYIEAFCTGGLSPQKVHLSGILDDPVRSLIGIVMFSIVGLIFIYVESCRSLAFPAVRVLLAITSSLFLVLCAACRSSIDNKIHNTCTLLLLLSLGLLTITWAIALSKKSPSEKLKNKPWLSIICLLVIYFIVVITLVSSIAMDSIDSLWTGVLELVILTAFACMVIVVMDYEKSPYRSWLFWARPQTGSARVRGTGSARVARQQFAQR